MTARTATGMFEPEPQAEVVRDLLRRARRRLSSLDDAALAALLEDALYEERRRLERTDEPETAALLERLAQGLLRGSREDRLQAGLGLVEAWGLEVHGHFSPRVYRVVTRALPRAMAGLLTPASERLRDWRPTVERALRVEGPTGFLQELAQEATLILVPTHVSNLDSPVIGLSLYQAGLPPFRYGAGLNLFSNPVMGFFMSRLGAYTVDRLKRARLYKHVLKDYSVRLLTSRQHSLFFPGGTRSRSGSLEKHIKKGLLGTGMTAWQEMLERGRRDSEIYVVPLTLSSTLVLEANTLIDDYLAGSGKQRYIIDDDEFAQPRTVLSFGRRLLDLDGAVVARLGRPLDLLGFPVSFDPAERKEQALARRRYVTDRSGALQRDGQRDRVYTERLARSIVEAYPRNSQIMSTHLVAWVAWESLVRNAGTADPFRLVRVPFLTRHVERAVFLARLRTALRLAHAGAGDGRWHCDLPADAEAVLKQALDDFSRYHRSHVLATRGDDLVVEDPKLCLYYRNRLDHVDWEL